ncbi:hypothetical protein ACCUM_2976 [Candidatus Accumulibacter phosphatis]|uniref:Uncharacterized protein n=1 Tax=Candidatus Accumulibacter phosphatis TaxID=327160 RepID=A0A5S4EQD5_9PROT|nr:hypothetical protein ACCUM_2976 [Candidatus Accumulibacter phosphatis]
MLSIHCQVCGFYAFLGNQCRKVANRAISPEGHLAGLEIHVTRIYY